MGGFFDSLKKHRRQLSKMSDAHSKRATASSASSSSSRHKRRGFFYGPRYYSLWYRTRHPSLLTFRDVVVLGLLFYTIYELYNEIGPVYYLFAKKKLLSVCSCWGPVLRCSGKYAWKLWDDHVWALGMKLLPWAAVGLVLVLFAELVLTRLW
ncbi:hypothetical protein B0T19DRAFT_425021 [Cercophora scortea]|uniref:Uncharacterized protein n=1 Tax=Cercophora scortea TaxID=314031 RepID=A0AAE0IP52_9PEZI|nr:hypothetical protein B0T19DRAFT_425021 [Cercophora scortea]